MPCWPLPSCLVGLCHLVSILTLLECRTGRIDGIHDLVSKSLLHRSLGTLTGIKGYPAQTEGLSSLRTNLHGNLIGCTADSTSFDFENGHDILHSSLKNLKRFLTGLLTDNVESLVNDFLSDALLTVDHDVVDKACYEL